MDTRNVIAAISLSAAVIILYSLWFSPSPEEIKQNQIKQEQVQKNQKNSDTPSLDKNENFTKLSRVDALKESNRIQFENGSVVGSISLKGATIDDLTFKEYNVSLESDEKVKFLAPRSSKEGYIIESGFVTTDKNIDIPNYLGVSDILLVPYSSDFTIKGGSLYIAKIIMIRVSENVKRDIQVDMFKSLIKADTKLVDNKHSAKFVTNLTNDVSQITNLVSTAILNLFKDTLTLIGLLSVMFYQNWKLSLFAIIMIPVASIAAKTLGKRIGKVTDQQMKRAGILNSYLMEILKNHKLAKIFQRENYEQERANKLIDNVAETSKIINIVFV
mgnify:CR=1 FL=1